jgi:hypothetical protein
LRNEANFPGAREAELCARKPVTKLREILADLRGGPSGLPVSSAGYFSALIIGFFALRYFSGMGAFLTYIRHGCAAPATDFAIISDEV